MRAYLTALLLLCLLVGCGAEPTATVVPTDTPDAVATEVALMRQTSAAETAAAPTRTRTPTDTATPTATATQTPSPTATPTSTPVPPAVLEGTVLDESSGRPVEGARVATGEWQATTDSAGRFVLPDLPPGQYTVLVTAEDHDPVLSGIVAVGAGEHAVVDTTLPAPGAGQYPQDPMATNQIDPKGAPSAEDAERLARQQGFRGEVTLIQPVTLTGEYLVNYKKGDAIRSALAELHHPAWELVDEAGKSWYVIKVCGNLALAQTVEVEMPAALVAQPHPVVTAGDSSVVGYACPSQACTVAAELPAGWNGIALACSHGCEWLRVQSPGIAGECWVQRGQVEALGDLSSLPTELQATSGKIAFFSDRDSPGFGEIYLMNLDGSNQIRLTSDLHLPPVVGGGADWVLNFRWSPDRRQFFFNTGHNGRLYRVNADGRGGTLVAEKIFGIDLSPDGQRIVAAAQRGTAYTNDIIIMNTDATDRKVVTNDSVRASLGLVADSHLLGPSWSPDGTRIAFYSHSPDSICMVNANGAEPTILVSEMYAIAGAHMDWSPDGRHILFPETTQVGILDVTSSKIRYLAGDGLHAIWSPDGSRVVLSRPFGGKEAQIWIMNADGTGLIQLTFEGKNCCPVWLP